MKLVKLIVLFIVVLLQMRCGSKDSSGIHGCWRVVDVKNMKFLEAGQQSATQKIKETDSAFKAQISRGEYTQYDFDSLPSKLGVCPSWKKNFEFYPVTINNGEIVVVRDYYMYSIKIKKKYANRFIAVYKKRTDSLGDFVAEMKFVPCVGPKFK